MLDVGALDYSLMSPNSSLSLASDQMKRACLHALLSLHRMTGNHAILPNFACFPLRARGLSTPAAADFVSLGNGSRLPPCRQHSLCACLPIFKFFFCLEVLLRHSPLSSSCHTALCCSVGEKNVCPHTGPIPFLAVGRPP